MIISTLLFCTIIIIFHTHKSAGKTETTKKCLQFLSAMSSLGKSDPNEIAIEDKVLSSNPLLESFGNSKTSRNNNSSRFGKWLQVEFVKRGSKLVLLGANITQVPNLMLLKPTTQQLISQKLFLSICSRNLAL